MITIPPHIGIQADELRAKYSALELFGKPAGPWKIIGPLTFKAIYNNETLENTIPILISIPSDFPKTVPTVKAHQTNIIDNYLHVNTKNKTFCLATQIRLKMIFSKNPTLSSFVRELLIPFLYSAFNWLKTGEVSFPDSPHGPLGILLEYCQLFQVYDPEIVLDFLEILANSKLYCVRSCPCGSRKDFQSCHADAVKEIARYQKPVEFLDDCLSILWLRKVVSEQKTKKMS